MVPRDSADAKKDGKFFIQAGRSCRETFQRAPFARKFRRTSRRRTFRRRRPGRPHAAPARHRSPGGTGTTPGTCTTNGNNLNEFMYIDNDVDRKKVGEVRLNKRLMTLDRT